MYACIRESGAGFFDGGRRENPPITFRNPPWLTIQRIDSPRTPVAASAFPSLQWKGLDIRAGGFVSSASAVDYPNSSYGIRVNNIRNLMPSGATNGSW